MSSFEKELKILRDLQEEAEVEKMLLLKKALHSDQANEIMKANQYLSLMQKERDKTSGKSLLVDPIGYSSGAGYKEKEYRRASYETLRAMSRVHVPRMIINRRKDQFSEFLQPPPDKYSPGFVIRKKIDAFQKHEDVKYTKEEKKRISYLTDFVLNCGKNEHKFHGDDFEIFGRKIVDDSLSLDQATYEKVFDRKGNLVEFYATDAATFRIADTYDDDAETNSGKKVKGYYPSYVQIFEGSVYADFYPWELAFVVRNPSTNIYSNGYGRSELEDLIRMITAILNADTYNSNYFQVGTSMDGIFNVKKPYNQSRLEETRDNLMSTITGVRNMHKTPIMNAEEVEFIPLKSSNRDMEFSVYQQYLIGVLCGMYRIDPSECGFQGFGANQSMFESNKKDRLDYSRKQGLRPLLRRFQRSFNRDIIDLEDPEFELAFVGFNEDTEEKELEMDAKRVSTYMGVNEVRRQRGLPELDENDIILNPVYLQWKQAKEMKEAQENFNEVDEEVVSEDTEKGNDINPFDDLINSSQKMLMDYLQGSETNNS